MFTEDQARQSLDLLGIPPTHINLRKCARAKHLLDAGHVQLTAHLDECRVYAVVSQRDETKNYEVELNGATHSCSCPDAEHFAICKHIIACKMHEYKNPHTAHMTPPQQKEFNDWIDEQKQDDFEYFMSIDQQNWKETHLQSMFIRDERKTYTCDCGATEDRSNLLNAASGNWLCRPCARNLDDMKRALKAQEDRELEEEVKRFREAPMWSPNTEPCDLCGCRLRQDDWQELIDGEWLCRGCAERNYNECECGEWIHITDDFDAHRRECCNVL